MVGILRLFQEQNECRYYSWSGYYLYFRSRMKAGITRVRDTTFILGAGRRQVLPVFGILCLFQEQNEGRYYPWSGYYLYFRSRTKAGIIHGDIAILFIGTVLHKLLQGNANMYAVHYSYISGHTSILQGAVTKSVELEEDQEFGLWSSQSNDLIFFTCSFLARCSALI